MSADPADLGALLDGPRSSLCALADTLSELAARAFSVASGEPAEAEAFALEAAMAAADTFPLGSAESARLSSVMDEITALTAAAKARVTP